MNASFLQLVFPLFLCLMALAGFLVFYLESQQYVARDKVLRGVRWHSLACVLAAALLAIGQGLFANKRPENTDQVAALRAQLEKLSAENAGLEQRLASSDAARHDAEDACVELVARHTAVVLDLTMAHHEAASATVKPKITDPQENVVVSVRVEPSSNSQEVGSDHETVFEKLCQSRKALGASINPAYRPNDPAKREANTLIQRTLFALGAFEGPVRGDGRVTAEAVKRYQISQALPATGIVADRTINAMERDLEGMSQVAMSFDDYE